MQRLPAHGESGAVVDLRDEKKVQRFNAVELDALCQAVSRGLARREIAKGARIGILSENRHEFLACYFGIMRFGAVAVPINHKLPASTIDYIFKDSEIELSFCDSPRLDGTAAVPAIEFDAANGNGFAGFSDPAAG